MTIDATATLSELVITDPRRSRVLEDLGLDYCCHGQRPLGEAVREAGIDLGEVITALDLPEPTDPPSAAQPGDNASLAHEIVDTHHAYMWEEMPRLKALVDKVYHVHGQRHPELAGVREAYFAAVAALDPHMTTEERRVFPAISRYEKGGTAPAGGSFAEPIAQLRAEHDAVGELFASIRSLTDGYDPPEDACASYRMMLDALERMEADLHEHIHKENNILFPRVLDLEERAAAR